MKYKILLDKDTSRAYASYMHFLENSENPESAVVLVARDHNFYSQDFIRHATGETVSAPESIQKISGKTARTGFLNRGAKSPQLQCQKY